MLLLNEFAPKLVIHTLKTKNQTKCSQCDQHGFGYSGFDDSNWSRPLQEQRQLTHENVQRKQARTGEEREEEEEEQLSESESEDEDNEIIYNPKNLPLGWDGKVRHRPPGKSRRVFSL